MGSITRRDALRGIGVTIGAAALGCGHESGSETPDAASTPDGSPDAPSANACTATTTMTAQQLLAGIETFVILMMENRSFDHYLGARKLVEKRAGIDGLTGTESNPDPNGAPVTVHPLATYTPADPPHSFDASHAQWNLGANDGFVKAHAGADQADVMGYYTRDQVPITNALADQGAVCERWFASVMGPTWPN